MKVIAVTGSPHKNGKTNEVINEIIRGAVSVGHETVFYDVNELNPVTCQACMNCRKSNSDCVVEDGLRPYFKDLHEAGALIVGGPIYAGGFGGNLISYMNRHYSSLDAEWKVRIPAGIQLVGVVSQGQQNPEAYKDFVRWYYADFERRNMQLVDILYACGRQPVKESNPELLEKAYKIGHSLEDRRTSHMNG